jgi:hypothetical protein
LSVENLIRIIADIFISLDGFVTGLDPGPDNGLGTTARLCISGPVGAPWSLLSMRTSPSRARPARWRPWMSVPLPICGEANRLKRMLTDRDIVVKALATGRNVSAFTAGQLAEGKPVTIGADDDVT